MGSEVFVWIPDFGGVSFRGLISEQPDEGLFFLDTGNAPKGEDFSPSFTSRGFWGALTPPNPPRSAPQEAPGEAASRGPGAAAPLQGAPPERVSLGATLGALHPKSTRGRGFGLGPPRDVSANSQWDPQDALGTPKNHPMTPPNTPQSLKSPLAPPVLRPGPPSSPSGTPPRLGVSFLGVPSPLTPPFRSICAHQTPNGRKEKRRQEFWEKKAEKGIFPRGERRLRARLSRGGAPTPQKPPELGRSDPQRGFYDIWGEHSEFGGDLGTILGGFGAISRDLGLG